MPTNHKTRRKTKALVPNASSRPRSIPRFRGSSATAPVRTDPRHPRSTHSQPHPVPGPPDAKRRSERTGEVIAAGAVMKGSQGERLAPTGQPADGFGVQFGGIKTGAVDFGMPSRNLQLISPNAGDRVHHIFATWQRQGLSRSCVRRVVSFIAGALRRRVASIARLPVSALSASRSFMFARQLSDRRIAITSLVVGTKPAGSRDRDEGESSWAGGRVLAGRALDSVWSEAVRASAWMVAATSNAIRMESAYNLEMCKALPATCSSERQLLLLRQQHDEIGRVRHDNVGPLWPCAIRLGVLMSTSDGRRVMGLVQVAQSDLKPLGLWAPRVLGV
ncbi:unnamed protein product [Cutaneotrichosporon oleaginosum]